MIFSRSYVLHIIFLQATGEGLYGFLVFVSAEVFLPPLGKVPMLFLCIPGTVFESFFNRCI